MDYEKAYKEAFGKAKSLVDFCSDSELKTLEHVFPELKESKDEKISKEIISALRERFVRSESTNEWIEWLVEKGNKSIFKPTKEQLKALEFYFKNGIDIEGVYGKRIKELYDELKKL